VAVVEEEAAVEAAVVVAVQTRYALEKFSTGMRARTTRRTLS
jgi:hypothetical protein